MSNDLILHKTYEFVQESMRDSTEAGYHYHNFDHVKQVYTAVQQLGEAYSLNEASMWALKMAALFHDVGLTQTYKSHELQSVLIARKFLRPFNIHWKQVRAICRLIAATHMPQVPGNLLEQIMCDADMSHLPKENYPQILEGLRAEWRAFGINKMEDKEWFTFNIEFLKLHRYFTPFAKEHWEPGKLQNIELLNDLQKKSI